MSKPAKKSNNLLYILLGVTVIAAVFLNSGGDAPKKPKTTPTKVATKSPLTLVKGEVSVLEEDTTANFPPYKEKLKTSFKPLVSRNADALVNGPSNQIPSSFADGDGGWIYTGSATVDGRIQGLIENASTGEGVFLSPGQRWKKLVCQTIREDGMDVIGPDGDVRTIALLTEPKESEGIAPLNPSGLTGSIDVLPDPTAQGGARRGRRGNGGNNFGGGGGATGASAGGPGGDPVIVMGAPGP